MRDSFDPEWFTPAQVAELTQLSYKTVMREIRSHRLRATQITARGLWRIRIEDYDAWMRGVAPSVAPARHLSRRPA